MDDFARIYLELDNLNKRIYDMETVHPEEGESNMAKILEYTLTYSAGTLTATRTDSQTISQYEKVVIKATLVDFPTNDYATRLHISSATYSDSNEETYDDFQFHSYMLPEGSTKGVFIISLNKTLGDTLTIGDANTCPIMFEVLDESSPLYSNILNIELYKTNTTQSYTPDDLVSIFIKLNELVDRQNELEVT